VPRARAGGGLVLRALVMNGGDGVCAPRMRAARGRVNRLRAARGRTLLNGFLPTGNYRIAEQYFIYATARRRRI
jgi:hypothetical protein